MENYFRVIQLLLLVRPCRYAFFDRHKGSSRRIRIPDLYDIGDIIGSEKYLPTKRIYHNRS